jgi:maltose-binding protein MalE
LGDVWHVKCYFGVNEAAMRRQLFILAGLALSAMIGDPTVAVAQQSKQPAKQKKQSNGKAEQKALTGCVDQQDGQYVLIQELGRSVMANLEAEGFPTEGFAKHVGHKVTVRGTSNSDGGERPVFRVRSVEAISDTCGPEH